MSDVLFDLTDFTETTPVEPTRTYLMFECGIHRMYTDDWQLHLAECWNGDCPSCGEPIVGQFDMHTNHGPASRPAWDDRLCSKQYLTGNHARSAGLTLDGAWDHVWTNCHARAHHGQHKNYGYFAKGAPVECVAVYYVEKVSWLLDHRMPVDQIYRLTCETPREAALIAARDLGHAVAEFLHGEVAA